MHNAVIVSIFFGKFKNFLLQSYIKLVEFFKFVHVSLKNATNSIHFPSDSTEKRGNFVISRILRMENQNLSGNKE